MVKKIALPVRQILARRIRSLQRGLEARKNPVKEAKKPFDQLRPHSGGAIARSYLLGQTHKLPASLAAQLTPKDLHELEGHREWVHILRMDLARVKALELERELARHTGGEPLRTQSSLDRERSQILKRLKSIRGVQGAEELIKIAHVPNEDERVHLQEIRLKYVKQNFERLAQSDMPAEKIRQRVNVGLQHLHAHHEPELVREAARYARELGIEVKPLDPRLARKEPKPPATARQLRKPLRS